MFGRAEAERAPWLKPPPRIARRECEGDLPLERRSIEGAYAVRILSVLGSEEPRVIAGARGELSADQPSRNAIDGIILRRETGTDTLIGALVFGANGRSLQAQPTPNRGRGHQETVELDADRKGQRDVHRFVSRVGPHDVNRRARNVGRSRRRLITTE